MSTIELVEYVNVSISHILCIKLLKELSIMNHFGYDVAKALNSDMEMSQQFRWLLTNVKEWNVHNTMFNCRIVFMNKTDALMFKLANDMEI